MMIDSYSFGRIVIDGRTYNSDVIVHGDGVEANWYRKEGHSLCVQDLGRILPLKPSILIIGTGHSGAMDVPQETLQFVESKGIQVVVLQTKEACKRFNELAKSHRVVAALHLTC